MIAVMVGFVSGIGLVIYIKWFLRQTDRMKAINMMILIILIIITFFTVDWLEMFKLALDKGYFLFSSLIGIVIASIMIHKSRHSSKYEHKIKS